MHGPRAAGLLLPFAFAAAFATVIAVDVAWPFVRRLGSAITSWPPLARLRERAGRLPVAIALPLFLIPEACSRFGWVVSVWLALHGQPWRGLAVYVATKLIAGSLALWICAACLPVLLRVRWFATAHQALLAAQLSAASWVRGRATGRFGAAVALQRARLTGRSSAASPAPATPSAPNDPSRTG